MGHVHPIDEDRQMIYFLYEPDTTTNLVTSMRQLTSKGDYLPFSMQWHQQHNNIWGSRILPRAMNRYAWEFMISLLPGRGQSE